MQKPQTSDSRSADRRPVFAGHRPIAETLRDVPLRVEQAARQAPAQALRVLVVSQYSAISVGGAERYLKETTSGLRAQGLDVSVIAADTSSGWHAQLRLYTAGYSFAWPARVTSIIRRFRPDVVCAHFTVPGLVDVAVRVAHRHRTPVCLIYHSDVVGLSLSKRLLATLYHSIISRGTLDRATLVVTSSPAFRRTSQALKRLPQSRFVYAPPGVDLFLSHPESQPQPVTKYLLFVGKADNPAKGFADLYRAWQQARQHFPDLQLYVAGCTTLKRFPGVHFFGYVSERPRLLALYAGATATVLPSLSSESFGMSLAEALCSGCPVIATGTCGVSAFILDGSTGYVVPPRDNRALRDAIVQAVSNSTHLKANILRELVYYRSILNWETTTTIISTALQTAATNSSV